jgi:cobalt-zinc-cadmium resistance protein CzcA
LFGAIVLVTGLFAWLNMPIDAFPDVTNVQVMILAEAQGFSPEEVERLVTFPIEVQMSGLPNMRLVRSLSQSGLSQVVVIFEDDVDTNFARELVFQRLSVAQDSLPDGIVPKMGPISTGLGEIYQYTVESGFYCPQHKQTWSPEAGQCSMCNSELVHSDHDMMSLRTIQDWLISPELKKLPGINEINTMGGLVRQYHIVVDPAKLIKFGVELNDILEAVSVNNSNAAAGFIVKDFEQINVVSRALLKNTDDINNIVVKSVDVTPVYIRDMAEIKMAPSVQTGGASKAGRGPVVVGMAIMLKGENSKFVVDRVKWEITEIQKTLPAGVKINPFYDRTDLIQSCIRTVSRALAQGGIFVILVLFLLLWDMRAALIVALSLPLTLAATFILMDWQDVTANLMSLGGLVIAIGLVVDAAIIVTENIVRHMSEKAQHDISRTEVTYASICEIVRPVIFAVFIIVVVFVPLFTLQSLEGKMFKPLALTICFALISSLVVSLTVVPVLASIITKRGKREVDTNPLLRFFHGIHIPALKLALKGRWVTIAVAAVLMILSIFMFGQLGTEFLPPLDEGAIAINIVRLPTAGLAGSIAQSHEIENHLLRLFPDEIETIVSKTGRAEISEDPMGPEQTDLIIILKPYDQWKAVSGKPELIERIEKELKVFPGIRPAFSQPIALRVNELISGIKSEIAIKIFGDDIDTLLHTAERIAPVLSSIDGARDVAIEQVSGFSQFEVKLDRQAMARHKINADNINGMLEAAVAGKSASTLYENLWPVDIVVRLPESVREGKETLESILIASPLGYSVPLSEVASIDLEEAPARITREDSRRKLIVECNVRGRDIGSFVSEAQQKLAEIEQGLPSGYRLVWGGQFENMQRAMRRLAIVVPIVLLLIFVLLVSALGSFRSATLIMVNLPFAVIGGVAAMYFFEIHLSVLVSFCDQLRKKGLKTLDAVYKACFLRVRPLVMTTMTTLLGLLPMLYATGAGSEIQRPLVVVIFGGMISSLILELIVLPVLYVLVNPDKILCRP